jgi:hypothetical protein
MTGNRLTAWFVLIAPLVLPVHGQTLAAMQSGSSRLRDGVYSGRATFGTPRKPFTVVAGAPYSAEPVSEIVQTLEGGAHVTRAAPSRKIYRDAVGRTRTESYLIHFAEPAPSQNPRPLGPLMVEIDDPTARVFYLLDTQRHVAHRGALPVSADPPTALTDAYDALLVGVNPQAPGQAVVTSADLGSQIVEGVLAQGRRITATWPTGSRGNDKPLVSTAEIWRSPDLKVTVLTKISKPTVADQTNRFTNISTIPPDLTLFQPPVDYQVVDEPGTFTITYP